MGKNVYKSRPGTYLMTKDKVKPLRVKKCKTKKSGLLLGLSQYFR